jgi:magnesium chelatase subunit D
MTANRSDSLGTLDVALALIAVDPIGLGGVVLRAQGCPDIKHVLTVLRTMLRPALPLRRLPAQVADARLLGGLDLASTLHAGKPVFERGLLADVDGGYLVVPMAERLPSATTARVCAALDAGEVVVARDGFTCRSPARFAVLAVDESASEDEQVPAALLERLALVVDIAPAAAAPSDPLFDARRIDDARARLSEVAVSDEIIRAICCAATGLGIASVRVPLFALKAVRILAALDGRTRVEEPDAIAACRLVLAPRATLLPAPADQTPEPERQDPGEPPPEEASAPAVGELEEVLINAVRATIPEHVLAKLLAPTGRRHADTAGAGTQQSSSLRGRPIGTRRGDPRSGLRLNIVETLRAAAPWQALRCASRGGDRRVQVRRDDFRINRFVQNAGSAVIFVVDASGSSALHRLAEAKGAIELLLADCYRRRDQVALIAFRGRSAVLLLPPTRSLTRAKRCLATLAGGGGTPVAIAIDSANALADGLRRKGCSPIVVLLTDGRANVARDGEGGRERAEADAFAAARRSKASGLQALLVDISPAPGPHAERLATNMGARYLPLPHADAALISQAVRTAAAEVHLARTV